MPHGMFGRNTRKIEHRCLCVLEEAQGIISILGGSRLANYQQAKNLFTTIAKQRTFPQLAIKFNTNRSE